MNVKFTAQKGDVWEAAAAPEADKPGTVMLKHTRFGIGIASYLTIEDAERLQEILRQATDVAKKVTPVEAAS